MVESAGRDVRRRILLVLGAAAAGIALNRFVQAHLATLQTLAANDPLAARAQLAEEVRAGGVALFAVTAALGASIIAASLRARRLLRFPPPGMWSWGGARTVSGPAARRFAGIAFALGTALIVCSLAGGALSWQMGTRLLACRAGVRQAAQR